MSGEVIIAAGGTGGHMFPALALAAELERRGRPATVVCDRRGARYVGEVPHLLIRAASPSGPLARRLAGFAKLVAGLARSLAVLRRRRPAAVAAFGGYAAVPVALAAHWLRIPVLVHEQNAVLGRANRLIARRAARLALTFADTRGAERVPAERRVVTGNPVRAEVAAQAGTPYAAPETDGSLRLLVVGGSQGARIFSKVVPAALALLPEELRRRIHLTQQCRPEDLEPVADAYRALDFAAELDVFFADLPDRLARAHLVISRSGASSVAELLALGRPALFVPYHHAADDHQRANGAAAASAGAAWLLDEAEFTAAGLAEILSKCLNRPEQLAGMAERARALGRPGAAAALADAVESLMSLPIAQHHLEVPA